MDTTVAAAVNTAQPALQAQPSPKRNIKLQVSNMKTSPSITLSSSTMLTLNSSTATVDSTSTTMFTSSSVSKQCLSSNESNYSLNTGEAKPSASPFRIPGYFYNSATTSHTLKLLHPNEPAQIIRVPKLVTRATSREIPVASPNPTPTSSNTCDSQAAQTFTKMSQTPREIPKKSLYVPPALRNKADNDKSSTGTPTKVNAHNKGSKDTANNNPRGKKKRKGKHKDCTIDGSRTVLVSGFPSYTRGPALRQALAGVGEAHIAECRDRLAVVVFPGPQPAAAAVAASGQLQMYGEFLDIKPYTSPEHVKQLFKSYRKVLNKEEGNLIEPSEIDLSGDFEQQVENVLDAIRLTREEVESITTLYGDLESVLQEKWPGCRALPFGSIASGLGLKSSDADCYVDVGGARAQHGEGAGAAAAAFVGAAHQLLARRPELFARCVPIPRANTPILKFVHVPTGVRCDLSAKTPLGVRNSVLVRALLGPLAPAALLLKYWARAHRLSGTGRLSNYALALLLLFHLQRQGVAPPVRALQPPPPACALPVDGWDAGFEPPPPSPPPGALPSTREVLAGFFRFYAQFDLERLVVCPHLGYAAYKWWYVDRSLAEVAARQPRYAANVGAGRASALRVDVPLCVQDPFELTHNVASAVPPQLARRLLAQLRLAARAADEAGFLREALLRWAPDGATRACVRLLPYDRLELWPAHWRELLRDVLLEDIFEEQLGANLEPLEGSETDNGLVWERYRCSCGGPAGQRVRFKLALGLREAPQRAHVVVEPTAGQALAVRDLMDFANFTLAERFYQKMRPYLGRPRKLRPECAPGPAPAPSAPVDVAATLETLELRADDDGAGPAGDEARGPEDEDESDHD